MLIHEPHGVAAVARRGAGLKRLQFSHDPIPSLSGRSASAGEDRRRGMNRQDAGMDGMDALVLVISDSGLPRRGAGLAAQVAPEVQTLKDSFSGAGAPVQ